MPMFAAALTGFTAGCVHGLSGPDHLAAIAPVAFTSRTRPWLAGAHWGCGHALGVALVGGIFLGLRDTAVVSRLVASCEQLAGFVLIAIGLYGLRLALSKHVHSHEHVHDELAHVHFHTHPGADAHPAVSRHANPHFHSHSAFVVGTLHGFAGGSHFWGVLPALAFPSAPQSVAYLAAYAGGCIAAMAGFSVVLSRLASSLSEQRRVGVYRVTLGVLSVFATGIGVAWVL